LIANSRHQETSRLYVICVQLYSNLQHDYVAAAKIAIQNVASVQRMLASNVNFPIVIPQYTGEFVKRSNEITENIVSAVRINNLLTVNAINAAAENFRTSNRTIESVTEFNTSATKAWNSFLTTQQQFVNKQWYYRSDSDGIVGIAGIAEISLKYQNSHCHMIIGDLEF